MSRPSAAYPRYVALGFEGVRNEKLMVAPTFARAALRSGIGRTARDEIPALTMTAALLLTGSFENSIDLRFALVRVGGFIWAPGQRIADRIPRPHLVNNVDHLKRGDYTGVVVRQLAAFFLLTFLVSWACFFGSAAVTRAGASPAAGVAGAIYIVGVFAPALVALALTALATGRGGTFALVRRMVQMPLSARWYLFALGYMVSIKLAAALVYRLATGGWPAFGETPWYLLILAIPFSTPVQSGEELGWRGFALPRLASRFGLAWASLGLGAIWALWHLPFFFIAGVDKTGQSFPMYMLGTMAISVAMAWLYWRTSGSLLATMLMHAAVNNTTGVVPTATTGATHPFSLSASLIAWLTVGIMWIVAAWCLWQMRGSTRGEFAGVV